MDTVSKIVGGAVAAVVVAAVTVLTWHGTITGDAATGFFSLILGALGVGVAHNSGVASGAKAARFNSGVQLSSALSSIEPVKSDG